MCCDAGWSPDSRLIAFAANLEGHYALYVTPATGGKPHPLTSGPADDGSPHFSRDGKWIYFHSNRSGEYQIWKMPATGGEPVQVTDNIGFAALESPDGAYLYYTQTYGPPSALWRIPVSGGQPVKLLEGVIQNAFAMFDKGIYYIDKPSAETRLQFYDFTTAKSTTVARNLGDVMLGLTVSPDGRMILYSKFEAPINDLVLVENFR